MAFPANPATLVILASRPAKPSPPENIARSLPPISTILPTTPSILPPANITGPAATASIIHWPIVAIVAESSSLNLSIRPVAPSIKSLRTGVIASPNFIPAASVVDFNWSILPCRLSCIVAAKPLAAPSDAYNSLLSAWNSSSPVFNTANIPDIASCPNMEAAACAC